MIEDNRFPWLDPSVPEWVEDELPCTYTHQDPDISGGISTRNYYGLYVINSPLIVF